MNNKTQKRALPPTPATSTKYTNVSSAIPSLLDVSYESLPDRERRWYNDLLNCQKTLEQKDSTINNLKTIVMEWKNKSMEHETSYKETRKRLEDREQFLIKQHEAEIRAMTKVQADQANEHLDMILQLEQENRLLKQQLGQPSQRLIAHQPTSTTSILCNSAEAANKSALENVSNSKENADELIQRISDMVNSMEGTLHDFKNNQDGILINDIPYEEDHAPPALTSDTSSCSSSDEFYMEIKPSLTTPLPKKKRSATIPNFLFRNKKLLEEPQRKRNQSLHDHKVQRKPIRHEIKI
ncbi:uncharacterized protein EV154DRAFT_82902 [Mucor mucedo]|uniref:uncharacterized protein n=1 Tax=Mucor mucedo TaxID=29922 RepID=UPI00221F4AAA|nr:uncharacterized protein EV154DRAFT_82902 [Mucor mucedo]KAI7894642.1 hypothetical protein EV154DRAFT_82902 [Mucor mucedo]